MATHEGNDGNHVLIGDSIPSQTSKPTDIPVRGARQNCVAEWLRRHQVFCVMAVLLMVYGTMALAPGWLSRAGLTCEAKACLSMRGPYYQGLENGAARTANWIVMRVKSILNEPGQGAMARGTLNGEILEVLKGELKVGAEVAVSGMTGTVAVDSTIACLLARTDGEGPLGGWLLPLTAPYKDCGLYRALCIRCDLEKESRTVERLEKLAQGFQALDTGNAYDDGRMFLLHLAWDLDFTAGVAGDHASPVLVKQLLKIVRTDLPKAPKPVSDIHWALCGGYINNREQFEARVADQIQVRLADTLARVTAGIPDFAKLESWTQAIGQAPSLLGFLNRVASPIWDPDGQAYVGRQLANWLATAVAEQENNLQDKDRRWPVSSLSQLVSTCDQLDATAALPLVRSLAASLTKDQQYKANWQQQAVYTQALVAQVKLSGGADCAAVMEVWDKGFRPYELNNVLLQFNPGMLPRFLAAMQKEGIANDLDSLRSLPVEQADSALLAMFRRGRLEAMQYVSAEALRQPQVLDLILTRWRTHGADYQTWYSLLYQATDAQFQTQEEWETWYWGELCKVTASPAMEARVRAELEKCAAPEAATRQAACKAIVQMGGRALAVVAAVEHSDRRLEIRDAARGILRTQPPAVNLFRETRYTAEDLLLADLPVAAAAAAPAGEATVEAE